MSAPRQVLPGTTYLVTRRCLERQFFLRPGKLTNHILRYSLAVAAKRYGIRLHAFCVLSNHYHLLLTDPAARLPAFAQYLNGLLARVLNAALDRRDHFWASDTYSAVALATPEDVLAKATYTLANPVAAGLVHSGKDWPGLWSAPERVGTVQVVTRPKHFFDAEGPLPLKAKLELTAPPGLGSVGEYKRRLLGLLSAREAEERKGKAFLGVRRVLAQPVTARPATPEPKGGLNPRVAAQDKWKRVEILQRLKEWLDAYKEAWEARRAGKLRTVFPAGTYLLRVLHNAPCADTG